MNRVVLTHRGWFGLCPVYVGDINSDKPFIDPRHWSLAWLFWLSECMFGLAFFCVELMVAEPHGFRLSGLERMDQPKWIEVEASD